MSDFSDACYCDSYSYPYFSGWRKVRKPHRCVECGYTIPAGAIANYHRGKCEGEWFNGYTCAGCMGLYQHMQAHVPCFCYAHHDLWGQLTGDLRDSNTYRAAELVNKEVPGFLFGVLRRIVLLERGEGVRP